MTLYTKQGYVKGSYEAYKWLLDNHPLIDQRVDTNTVVLLFKGHSLLNAVQDAMDPFEFEKEYNCHKMYRDFDNVEWGFIRKPKMKPAPVWRVAEGMREHIVAEVSGMNIEKRKMVEKLRQREIDAIRFEPMRARQMAWEDDRWMDLPQSEINLRNEFNRDMSYGNFDYQITKLLDEVKYTDTLFLYVFEKLNGYYMSVVCDKTKLDSNGKIYSLFLGYHELYEEVRNQAEAFINFNYNFKQVGMKAKPKVKKQNPVLKNVERVMNSQYPSDLNTGNLF
ncbi:MAG: hypothetical protein WCJ62_12980 [Flavobacterium sp.]